MDVDDGHKYTSATRECTAGKAKGMLPERVPASVF